MARWTGWASALALASLATPVAAKDRPLFDSDTVLDLVIDGPIRAVDASAGRANAPAQPATLMVAGSAAALPITLEPRGITRRRAETCEFTPLRVSFAAPPPEGSPFAGQKKLKLITHCRNPAAFQKYALVEYAGYRLYNLLTPVSFRARLARIEYRDRGRPMLTRMGFFLEDIRDVAHRNGLREVHAGPRLDLAALDTLAAGRVALFEYAISNLDWAMNAGPAGAPCCHNSKPVSPDGRPVGIVPVPYDWDYSGMVDPPYAAPPDGFDPNMQVTERVYRGACRFNEGAAAAAAAMRARQGEMLAVFDQVPGLEPSAAARARGFLASFYARIATDEGVRAILAKCLR